MKAITGKKSEEKSIIFVEWIKSTAAPRTSPTKADGTSHLQVSSGLVGRYRWFSQVRTTRDHSIWHETVEYCSVPSTTSDICPQNNRDPVQTHPSPRVHTLFTCFEIPFASPPSVTTSASSSSDTSSPNTFLIFSSNSTVLGTFLLFSPLSLTYNHTAFMISDLAMTSFPPQSALKSSSSLSGAKIPVPARRCSSASFFPAADRDARAALFFAGSSASLGEPEAAAAAAPALGAAPVFFTAGSPSIASIAAASFSARALISALDSLTGTTFVVNNSCNPATPFHSPSPGCIPKIPASSASHVMVFLFLSTRSCSLIYALSFFAATERGRISGASRSVRSGCESTTGA
mmetsp:Transcript_10888/g.27396  ORF Transcript_10888/g.27396 Transcript_10888/m.27396 type:complete len:347 (+) Transcript_10888:176-1216(+)